MVVASLGEDGALARITLEAPSRCGKGAQRHAPE
jgi:hypothetical protein